MKSTKKQIMNILEKVMDPELNMSIVDLGLIYDVIIDKKVTISMTLTTIGCPLFSLIEQEIRNKLFQKGIEQVDIVLTFDPPWNMDRLSERARAKLGI